jgi:hypothetical protein
MVQQKGMIQPPIGQVDEHALTELIWRDGDFVLTVIVAEVNHDELNILVSFIGLCSRSPNRLT